MNEALRRLVVATYAVALFFVLSPIVDVVTNAWPINVGSEQWRFGFAGIASNYLVSALFGAMLAALLAAATGSRIMLRVIAALSIAAAVVLLVLVVGLLLDSIQLYGEVRPEDLQMFRIGALKSGAKIGAVMVVMAILALSCFRAARTLSGRTEAPPVVR